jgi:hypothetical protein
MVSHKRRIKGVNTIHELSFVIKADEIPVTRLILAKSHKGVGVPLEMSVSKME